jgi:hypothetical protein
MSMIGCPGLGLLIASLVWCCLPSRDGTYLPSQARQQGAVQEWVEQNYEALVQRMLPERLDLKPFPNTARWIMVSEIHDAFESSEYWFSIRTNYDGRVEASVRVPRGGSLARQMQKLRERMPDSNLESLSKMLQIDEYNIKDKELPELKRLAQDFQAIQISPVMPDLLIMDAYGYRFWCRSQYGQEMSAYLSGPGPNASKQPQLLVEWAERVRTITGSYIRTKLSLRE